jgi:hypothetical protein
VRNIFARSHTDPVEFNKDESLNVVTIYADQASRGQLWQEFFHDPSEWRDNRAEKVRILLCKRNARRPLFLVQGLQVSVAFLSKEFCSIDCSLCYLASNCGYRSSCNYTSIGHNFQFWYSQLIVLSRSYKMLTWSSLFHRQIRTIQTSNTNAQRKHFGLVKTQFGSKKNWLPCHKVTCIMQTVVLWRSRMENQASTTVGIILPRDVDPSFCHGWGVVSGVVSSESAM